MENVLTVNFDDETKAYADAPAAADRGWSGGRP